MPAGVAVLPEVLRRGQDANKFAFALDLFVPLASPKVLRLGKMQMGFAFALDLFVPLRSEF